MHIVATSRLQAGYKLTICSPEAPRATADEPAWLSEASRTLSGSAVAGVDVQQEVEAERSAAETVAADSQPIEAAAPASRHGHASGGEGGGGTRAVGGCRAGGRDGGRAGGDDGGGAAQHGGRRPWATALGPHPAHRNAALCPLVGLAAAARQHAAASLVRYRAARLHEEYMAAYTASEYAFFTADPAVDEAGHGDNRRWRRNQDDQTGH